jgi:hypothetical protein
MLASGIAGRVELSEQEKLTGAGGRRRLVVPAGLARGRPLRRLVVCRHDDEGLLRRADRTAAAIIGSALHNGNRRGEFRLDSGL